MAVVINRAGLGDQSVQNFCRHNQLPILTEIPFDRRLAEAYSKGLVLAEAIPDMHQVFEELLVSLRELAETSGMQETAAHA
jgi:MinD superfamily P-loop ATPase